MKLMQLNSKKIKLLEIIQGCLDKSKVDEYHLFRMYFPFAMSVARRYVMTTDESKEVVNESFLKIFNSLKFFDQQKEIEPWIAKIVANTCIDHIRKQKSRITFKIQEDFILEGEMSDEGFEDIDSLESLLPVLQLLPPRYKLVFNLYVFEEYSHKEIAEKLKISVGTSKSNYYRAKMILKKAMITERRQLNKEKRNG